MATQTELQTLELHALELLATEPPATSGANPYAVAWPRKDHQPPAEASPTTAASDSTVVDVLSKPRAFTVIGQQLGVALFSSFCNGAIVVGLPAIAASLELDQSLLVWPTSVFYLTAGSCLLMAGSIADVAGTKSVNLVGSFLAAVFALAFGLARTGGELIAFRALQGFANAIIVPSSISIISTSVEEGRPRNLGFACLGFAAPIGFSLGLVLGGVMIDSTGWRPAFYLAGATGFALFLIGVWALPPDAQPQSGLSRWKRLGTEIDWVGAVVASTGLATLSYSLA
jgi:MFS family permease